MGRVAKFVIATDDKTDAGIHDATRNFDRLGRSAKENAKEATRSIIDMATESKRHLQGIKNLLELGGLVQMARMVGGAFRSLTDEAMKISAPFQEANAALDVMKGQIGGALVKALEPLAKGFTEVLKYGTAIFQNFPEVAKTTFAYVGAIIQKTFSWEGIKSILIAVGEGVVRLFKSAFEYIPRLFADAVKLMLAPIRALGEYIWDTLKKAFSLKFEEILSPGEYMKNIVVGTIEAGKDLIGDAVAYIKAQAGNLAGIVTDIAGLYAEDTKAYAATMKNILGPSLEAFAQKLNQAGESFQKLTEAYQSQWAKVGEIAKSYLSPLEKAAVDLEAKIESISKAWAEGSAYEAERTRVLGLLNADLEEVRRKIAAEAADLANAILANQVANRAESPSGAGPGPFTWGTPWIPTPSRGAAGAGAGAGGLGAVMEALGPFAAALGESIAALASVNALLNPLTTIIGGIMQVLAPVIDGLLAPLVGILTILGQTIGAVVAPLLERFAPIIKLVTEYFVFFYNNALRPVANMIIGAANLIYNGVAIAANAIIDLVNFFLPDKHDIAHVATKTLEEGMLQTINYTDVVAAGSSAIASGGGSTPGATYTGAQSITFNFYNQGNVVGSGGLEELATIIDQILAQRARYS